MKIIKTYIDFIGSLEKGMIENYGYVFSNHFINSRAGILMKRQGIIGNEIKYITYITDNYLFGIAFYFSKSEKKIEIINKKGRTYKDGILYFVKTQNKNEWDYMAAIQDSQKENKLIFDNIKIIK